MEDIAVLISTTTTVVCDAVFFVLQLSYLVGQTLVAVILHLANHFLTLWDAITLTVSIICEDSILFIKDAGEKCLFVFNCLAGLGTALYSTILSGIISVHIGASNCVQFLWHVVDTVLLTLSNSVSLLHDGLIFLRQMLILLGSSIWLCLTILPVTLAYYFQILVETAISVSNYVKSLSLFLINVINDSVHNVLSFFFAIPSSSGYGLLCGTVFLLIVFKNYRKICFFILQGLQKLYCCLVSFSISLWSGKFLENKNYNCKTDTDNINSVSPNSVNVDDRLCVVCQDNCREIITFPCKHLCLCKICCLQICKSDKSCPICRKHVSKTVKVYMP